MDINVQVPAMQDLHAECFGQVGIGTISHEVERFVCLITPLPAQPVDCIPRPYDWRKRPGHRSDGSTGQQFVLYGVEVNGYFSLEEFVMDILRVVSRIAAFGKLDLPLHREGTDAKNNGSCKLNHHQHFSWTDGRTH